MSGKKLAGIGCGVLILGAVAAGGGLTWYSTQLSREYKKVRASEQELVAATAPAGVWTPPAGGVPDPARLEAFAGVREELATWRGRLAAEDRAFAARRGGNWFLRAGDASELARVLSGFWLARNEALHQAGLGPDEYEWLYGLVYHGWLGHDAAAGRQPGSADDARAAERADDGRFEARRELWRGGVTPEAAAALAPLRERLAAGWTEETNPVELIFVGEPAATAPAR